MLWFSAPVISQRITDRKQRDSCPVINARVRLYSDRVKQTENEITSGKDKSKRIFIFLYISFARHNCYYTALVIMFADFRYKSGIWYTSLLLQVFHSTQPSAFYSLNNSGVLTISRPVTFHVQWWAIFSTIAELDI
jgi:hypothetical protein